ncbi:hypothetical protein ACVIGB_000789 [Bradyrhizobium sp. USDA 4341]
MADLMSKKESDACVNAERRAHFDRSRAENDLDEVMRSLGIGSGAGPSVVPGVAVYLCDDWVDEDRIRKEMEKRGHKIVEVRSTTWVIEDGTDEDVIAVAFDTPCLPAEWREEAPAPTI